MRRRPTVPDLLRGGHFPPPAAVAKICDRALGRRMLQMVWDAFDDVAPALSLIDWTQGIDDVERGVTEVLETALQQRWRAAGGFPPFHVKHEAYEYESRSAPPARPPQYDIAFRLNDDERVMWPLEAKAIADDRDTSANLKDYIDTVRDRFLTGYYAPFSNGGAMLAFLRSGDPTTLLTAVAGRLQTTLAPSSDFPSRDHRVSTHVRRIPAGKPYQRDFECHHLVMPLSAT